MSTSFTGFFSTFSTKGRTAVDPFRYFFGPSGYRQSVDGPSTQIVELKACGQDDPDGRRAASVLAAYFYAQQTRMFRQRLWGRLALCAGGAWLIEAMTPLLPQAGLLIALVLVGAVGTRAAVVEWRARKALTALLGQCPDAVVGTVGHGGRNLKPVS